MRASTTTPGACAGGVALATEAAGYVFRSAGSRSGKLERSKDAWKVESTNTAFRPTRDANLGVSGQGLLGGTSWSAVRKSDANAQFKYIKLTRKKPTLKNYYQQSVGNLEPQKSAVRGARERE